MEEKQFITLSAPTSSFQRHAKPFLFYFFGLLFLSTSGCCLDQLAKWSACFWPHSERHSCPLVRKKREEGDAHGDLDDQVHHTRESPGGLLWGIYPSQASIPHQALHRCKLNMLKMSRSQSHSLFLGRIVSTVWDRFGGTVLW